MKPPTLRTSVARFMVGMSSLQREITEALMTDDDRWADESLAERYGTTLDAIRIERALARRRLSEILHERRST
jgi:hypothetical protein